MLRDQDFRGEMCQFDEPDWQPLYDLVGIKLADWFMWMCEIELKHGVRVHAYKHITTREHLHLGVDGRAFAYVPCHRYREIDRRQALDIVFDTWEEVASGPDDRDRIALKEARRAAGPRAGARRSARPRQERPGSGAAA